MYDTLNSSFLHFSISPNFTIILTFCFPIRISNRPQRHFTTCENQTWRFKLLSQGYILCSGYKKLACPRVNDDQKKDVDDQKLNSGRPHDNQNFLELSLYYTVDFPHFSTA